MSELPPDAKLPECFFITPIGADGSEVRHRSDQIFDHVIKPIARECGYEGKRADHIAEPGMIATQVLNRVIGAPMVVADLTGHNPNVFYELAVRHAIRKPYVQIIRKGETKPFDVAGIRTIEIDHTDLDSVAAAKAQIRDQILFAKGNPDKVESPISVAVDLESLRQSGDPVKRQLADVLSGLSELKAMFQARLPNHTAVNFQADGPISQGIAARARIVAQILSEPEFVDVRDQEGRIIAKLRNNGSFDPFPPRVPPTDPAIKNPPPDE